MGKCFKVNHSFHVLLNLLVLRYFKVGRTIVLNELFVCELRKKIYSMYIFTLLFYIYIYINTHRHKYACIFFCKICSPERSFVTICSPSMLLCMCLFIFSGGILEHAVASGSSFSTYANCTWQRVLRRGVDLETFVKLV